MNRTDVLIAIAEVARSGGATAPEDAISQLAMIIDDLGGRQNETVTIEGNVLKPDRTVVLNTPTTDPLTRMTMMTNGIQLLMLLTTH